MSPSPSILIYGSDPDLIETRRLVLKHSGFDVVVASSVEKTTTFLASRFFDLFILCHSVSLANCEAALHQVNSLRPTTKVLILQKALSHRSETDQHTHLSAFAAPETLIAAARELAPGTPSSRKAEADVQRHREVVQRT